MTASAGMGVCLVPKSCMQNSLGTAALALLWGTFHLSRCGTASAGPVDAGSGLRWCCSRGSKGSRLQAPGCDFAPTVWGTESCSRVNAQKLQA